MKKSIFSPVVIGTVAGIFFAQISSRAQGIYAGIGGGYGFPSEVKSFNGYGLDGSSTSTTTEISETSSTTLTSKSFSLGSGVSAGIYGGYMINKNVGFELEIDDKFSSNTTSTFTSTYNSIYYGESGSVTSVYTLASGNLITLTPAVRFQLGNDKLQPYLVTGLIVGFPPSATLTDVTTASETGGPTNTTNEVYTYSGGGPMIGFHGAVGVTYMLNDKIGISGEVFANFLNWRPAQKQITTLTYNGKDSLANMTTSETTTKYMSSFTTTSTPSPGTPTQSTYIYMPFSSFGIKVSVHFYFGGGSVGAGAAK